MSLNDPSEDRGEMNEGRITGERLVETSRDAPATLQRVEAALDEIARSIQALVQASLLSPIRRRGYHGLDVPISKFFENPIRIVGHVGDAGLARKEVDELVYRRRVMGVAGREVHLDGTPVSVGCHVYFAGEAPS